LFDATCAGYVDYGPHSITIDNILSAASGRSRCHIMYKSHWKDHESEFDVDPYLILHHKGALYAVVFVPAHDNHLFLPIQRIRQVEITNRKFTRSRSFSVEDLCKGRFGIFGHDGLEPTQIVLRFRADIAGVVSERIWHQSQKLTPNDDGSLTMELETVISDEVRAWVGSWLDRVTVVSPVDLLQTTDSPLKE